MVDKPKRQKKLPKDVRKLTTEETADRLFGRVAAKKLRKAAHETDSKKREK